MRIKWMLAFAALAAAGPASAATYFVSPAGSDTGVVRANNVGTPFRTIGRAVAALQSGDTLIVGDGNYQESVSLAGLRNVNVQAAAQAAVLDGHGVTGSQGMRISNSSG